MIQTSLLLTIDSEHFLLVKFVTAALVSAPDFAFIGAVKVSPAHDHADFLLSQRLSLPRLTVIGGDGTMTSDCGQWLEVQRFFTVYLFKGVTSGIITIIT